MRTADNTVIAIPYGQLHIDAMSASDHAVMRARQLKRLLIMIQPEEGPDDILWLCQQFADEIAALASTWAREQSGGVAA